MNHITQGRYRPRGKYGDAESRFHAARTMPAHFHHVCRGSILLSVKPSSLNFMDDTLLDGGSNAYVLTMRRDIASKGECTWL